MDDISPQATILISVLHSYCLNLQNDNITMMIKFNLKKTFSVSQLNDSDIAMVHIKFTR